MKSVLLKHLNSKILKLIDVFCDEFQIPFLFRNMAKTYLENNPEKVYMVYRKLRRIVNE